MRRALPFEIHVVDPCTESWDSMAGSVHRRHCASCDKTVHNFAAMTPRQIERLIAEHGGHLCARITRREDSSLVTLESTPPRSRFAGAALSATLALTPLAAFPQSNPSGSNTLSQPASASPAALPSTHQAMSGVITDNQSAVVVGATVTLILNGVALGSTKTNEVGQFEFAVIPGEYQLRVEAPGFATLPSLFQSAQTMQLSAMCH